LSYAVAAFPNLTRSYTSGKLGDFKDSLKATARSIVFWSLPITFLFIVLRAQIVRVILGSGSFSWDNTRLVAASLAVFSISIMAQGLIALFARAYYASGNTKTPLYVNFISSLSIIVFAFMFLNLFKNSEFFRFFIENILKLSGIKGTEVLMLPLAYSLGTILNAGLLWYFIKRDFMKKERFLVTVFFQSLGASFFIGVVSYLSLNLFSSVFYTNTFWSILFQGLISGILGICAGVMVLYLLGNKELKDLIQTLRTKFWKTKVIASVEEGL